jgi:hypothetical protein
VTRTNHHDGEQVDHFPVRQVYAVSLGADQLAEQVVGGRAAALGDH